MQPIQTPHPKARPVAKGPAIFLLVLFLGLAAVGAVAQTGATTGDTYLDPLAFARVDPGAESIPLSVKYQATGETRRAMGRYLLVDSQEMYLRSATLATILKAGRYWQGELRHLDLKVGAQTFRVTAGSRVVVTGDGEMLLPVPVLDHEGDLWLPMVFLEKVVGPQTRERVAWNAKARQLALGSADYSVSGLKVEVLGRTTAVHIFCREPLGYRTSSPRSGVIDLKIYGGEVNAATVGSSSRRGLVQSVSSRQHRDHATVTIRVDQLVGRYRTYTADEGREIVVVLEEEQVSTMPDPIPRGHASVNIEQGPVDVTNRIDVQTVVVDPGHGGHDVGAVSRRGIMEKDVNLGVAKELRRYLERESDLDVVLTPYFLSPARSDWAKSVEAAENQAGRTASSGGEPDDVEFIVWELVQNRFISSSSQLAETIQADVTRDLGLPNRGVRQAGFRVLVGAYMPAVLIELGFLSHAREEKRLGDSSYQRELAKAIGDAILTYRDQTGSGGEVADD
jgi:N-acetylmuramoyl-L-alanine amidase